MSGKEIICSICGKTLSSTPEYFFRGDDRYPVCDECYKSGKLDEYSPCRNCGKPIRVGYNICRKCHKETSKLSTMNYSFKPEPLFINKDGSREDKKTTYYGVELEFSHVSTSSIKRYLDDLLRENKIYCKPDGSLSDGIEVVTSPMDYSSGKRIITKVIEGACEASVIDDKHLVQNAGFHVHVNRDVISTVDLYKLNLLCNFKDNNIDKLYYLSGRSSKPNGNTDYDYCHSNSKRNIKSLMTRGGDRYVMLNERNESTIEFRMFKATADVEQGLGYLETVKLMLEFCHNNPLRLISVNNFLIYITTHGTNKFLVDRAKTALGKTGRPINNPYIIDRIKEIIDRYGEENVVRVINAIEKTGDETLYEKERDIIHKEYKCLEGNLFIDYMYRKLEEAECV